MKAGDTRYEVGTHIRITRIVSHDPSDRELEGRTGALTHPFGDGPGAILGVWLDPTAEQEQWLREDEGRLLPDHATRTGLLRSDQFEVID